MVPLTLSLHSAGILSGRFRAAPVIISINSELFALQYGHVVLLLETDTPHPRQFMIMLPFYFEYVVVHIVRVFTFGVRLFLMDRYFHCLGWLFRLFGPFT